MGIAINERLSNTSLEQNLRAAAVLEFTEEVFESDIYKPLEVLSPKENKLFIVNRNDCTLTVLSVDSSKNVTKETWFTDEIISMKEHFAQYRFDDNTPPKRMEITFKGGHLLEIDPSLSAKGKEEEVINQVNEDFEALIGALKNTKILK
ncbi:hypothetical protein [Alteribacillus sp. HJP-4]|uniref:hypothetical protein n=1 Tax=Alteribacillus sp. HJP-4 TaxID=2775394 RepID=UPI0035CCF947